MGRLRHVSRATSFAGRAGPLGRRAGVVQPGFSCSLQRSAALERVGKGRSEPTGRLSARFGAEPICAARVGRSGEPFAASDLRTAGCCAAQFAPLFTVRTKVSNVAGIPWFREIKMAPQIAAQGGSSSGEAHL